MKKTRLIFLLLIVSLISGMTSCSEDEDGPNPGDIWDFINYSIEFSISDTQLLNDEENLSKIKVTYNGKEYLYSKEESDRYSGNYSKATYCFPLAVRAYSPGPDPGVPNTILGFGEFRPNYNYKDQKLTVDWGNGRIDEVEFSIYTTWKKGDPTVHRKLKLNGKEIPFERITMPF